jgi:DNA repair exonuclease SbcCD ATPase subunit
VAESRTQAQADKADDLKSQVADLKTELSESRKEAKAAHQATAVEVEKWRETVALEHKRNAELQSERDNLAERLAALEAEKKEQENG